MSSIKLKHSGGNGVSIASPDTNPASDKTVKLPVANGTLLTTESSPSFRNFLYNGEMMINQRGTTTTVNGYGGPDRWKTSVGQAAFTASKDSESPPGFNSSLKLDCTTAATLSANNSIQIAQHLEGFDLQSLAAGTSSAKSLTLSFWVRSNKTGIFNTHIYQKDGGKLVSQNTTISSANTWEKKTFTVSGNTADTIANDNTKSLTIEFWLDSGPDNKGGTITDSWAASASNKYGQGITLNIGDHLDNEFYLSGVQLEIGEAATDYEHRSYGDELARCRRYYCTYVGEDGNGNNEPFIAGFHRSATVLAAQIIYPVGMRTPPSIDATEASGYWYIGGTNTGNINGGFSITTNSNSHTMCWVYATESGATVGQGATLMGNNSASYFALSAEL